MKTIEPVSVPAQMTTREFTAVAAGCVAVAIVGTAFPAQYPLLFLLTAAFAGHVDRRRFSRRQPRLLVLRVLCTLVAAACFGWGAALLVPLLVPALRVLPLGVVLFFGGVVAAALVGLALYGYRRLCTPAATAGEKA